MERYAMFIIAYLYVNLTSERDTGMWQTRMSAVLLITITVGQIPTKNANAKTQMGRKFGSDDMNEITM
jgi:hypothetical protein